MKIYLSYYFPERTNKVQFGIFGSFYFFFILGLFQPLSKTKKTLKKLHNLQQLLILKSSVETRYTCKPLDN